MADFNLNSLKVANQIRVHQVVQLGVNYFDVNDVCALLGHFVAGDTIFDCTSSTEFQICQFLVGIGLLSCSATTQHKEIFEPVSEEAQQKLEIMLELLIDKQKEARNAMLE